MADNASEYLRHELETVRVIEDAIRGSKDVAFLAGWLEVENYDGGEVWSVVAGWLDSSALAIEAIGSRIMGEDRWTTTAVEVLTAVGGPSCRLRSDGRRLTVTVDWWGEHAEDSVDDSELAAYLWDMVAE